MFLTQYEDQYTVFTWMQDDSKMTLQIKLVCRGKMYLFKSKMTPKNRISKKNILLLIAYT